MQRESVYTVLKKMLNRNKIQKEKTGIQCYCTIAFLLFCMFGLLPAHSFAIEAPRNPDSAKECAICHYRWIDTFFVDGTGSDLVDYAADKVVAKPEICFSCHDGSVVDSRDGYITTSDTRLISPLQNI